jgi:hypothetical protein
MERAGTNEVLRFHGTARALATYRGLCVVVDTVESVEHE